MSATPMKQLTTVLLAFGANLGDREATIREAQMMIANAAGVSEVKASPLRETIAFRIDGPDPDAPKYLNGVATLTTTLGAHELLDLVQSVEQHHGRTREVVWGDRTLDIDIIVFGGKAIADERLRVPHPRAHERDFVLSPWNDLDPHAVLMGHGRVKDLLEAVGDTTTAYDGASA
ncbi:2-amino-4-hydroxy-6-hydroxymethyldihydropteridine diphosphokinase [Leucobacter sp. UCMA 4100]|uniref:2-amino-4-hydroxy-6- hydroxymethyldihydropteridine diphosphokinase n=1 Tax=Leucobacter sp. UCMA 4100 TaxID=2810534 RepID=UPI0022EABD34|nr:2-amino-4-hydroxy-6-hydroxymethyldihydropteridine diphosphokinase [Leucobacter sp. UCMA 4100]